MSGAEQAYLLWCRRIERFDLALAGAFDEIPPTRLDLVEQIDTLHWFGFMLAEAEPD